MNSRVPPGLIRAAARAVAEAGGDMRDVEGLLDVLARPAWFSDCKVDGAIAIADLGDDELLDRAGPGATLEDGDGHEAKPAFDTPDWHARMDRRYPAKSDEWFDAMARRARERAQNHTATAKEWAALAQWRRYRAEYLAGPSPAWKPQEENR